MAICAKLAFVLLCLLVLLFTPRAKSEELWRLKIHYAELDETICAHYNFATEDSCIRAKVWFEDVSAWHGRNTYWCVLDNECPKE